jgi:hypothetical protein
MSTASGANLYHLAIALELSGLIPPAFIPFLPHHTAPVHALVTAVMQYINFSDPFTFFGIPQLEIVKDIENINSIVCSGSGSFLFRRFNIIQSEVIENEEPSSEIFHRPCFPCHKGYAFMDGDRWDVSLGGELIAFHPSFYLPHYYAGVELYLYRLFSNEDQRYIPAPPTQKLEDKKVVSQPSFFSNLLASIVTYLLPKSAIIEEVKVPDPAPEPQAPPAVPAWIVELEKDRHKRWDEFDPNDDDDDDY